ncbi:hypothetical protein MPH_12852 [Macrophomina phaseolina MS6]|uniref:Uncharacterized protein n=1 Tax=Macrophomina phaseolina (strain MS6) TaxID=1126212 RepID=K2RB71_MACPH|nr:hypothetical protein MPH_12852 [Macrophomina phaseolina MS6]
MDCFSSSQSWILCIQRWRFLEFFNKKQKRVLTSGVGEVSHSTFSLGVQRKKKKRYKRHWSNFNTTGRLSTLGGQNIRRQSHQHIAQGKTRCFAYQRISRDKASRIFNIKKTNYETFMTEKSIGKG